MKIFAKADESMILETLSLFKLAGTVKMHEVSPETVQAAQKHALELIEQGKHITDVAQKLK